MSEEPANSVEEPQDALIPNQDMPIRLPMFEGPLDLLLFLIRKNEIDIYDIPVISVTKQYLEILNTMEKLNLEIAGDFFVMAATLMYIKSRMLLPTNEQPDQPEDEEEEADPRWELVQQLLEYKKFKDAALQIEELIAQQQDYIPRFYSHKNEEREVRPLKNSDRIEVWNTFNLVLRRLAEKMSHGEIQDEEYTITDRMEFILQHMESHETFTFSSLFEEGKYNINLLVSTFLAILELTRLKRMVIRQDDVFEEIHCDVLPKDLQLDDSDEEAEINEESSAENEKTGTALE